MRLSILLIKHFLAFLQVPPNKTKQNDFFNKRKAGLPRLSIVSQKPHFLLLAKDAIRHSFRNGGGRNTAAAQPQQELRFRPMLPPSGDIRRNNLKHSRRNSGRHARRPRRHVVVFRTIPTQQRTPRPISRSSRLCRGHVLRCVLLPRLFYTARCVPDKHVRLTPLHKNDIPSHSWDTKEKSG